ncbi:uncharacterized protein CG3556, partial [Caerostris darwini]
LRAMAIIALSCSFNTKNGFQKAFLPTPSDLYKETIGQFKKLQMQDGRFGNVYTTAVITQALIASGQEHAKRLKLNTTSKYLMDHMNSPISRFVINPLNLASIKREEPYRYFQGRLLSQSLGKHGDDNSTAAEVMKLAEVEDPKYKCKQENMSGKTYVYEIANIANDPENGKFWLLYVGESNQTESLHRTNLNPEKLTLSNGQHLVFWYKTASL